MEGEGMLQVTESQEDHLRECFKTFDKDGSGRLDVCELGQLMQVLGMNPTPREIKMLIEHYDFDASGTLDYEEFRTMIIPALKAAAMEMRRGFEEAFQAFDKDGSGYLDKEEFKNALTGKGECRLSDADVDDLFQAVDINKDGKIDKNEMINLFCAVLEAWMDQ